MIVKFVLLALLLAINAFPSLIASYTFSGNTRDASGNGHDGLAIGTTAAADRFGKANSALSFDGIDDYVSLPKLGLAGQVTISGWFAFPEGIWPHHVALLGQGIGYSERWQLGTSNQEIFWYDRRGSDNAPYNFIRTTSANQWHHIAAVVTEDANAPLKVGIWLDGTWLGNLSTRGFQEIDTGCRIGSFWTEWGWEYSRGMIDDVNVYDHLLTEAEILGLYHAHPVPEPGAFTLLVLGLAGLFGLRRLRGSFPK